LQLWGDIILEHLQVRLGIIDDAALSLV
jgi:hypothetical protein